MREKTEVLTHVTHVPKWLGSSHLHELHESKLFVSHIEFIHSKFSFLVAHVSGIAHSRPNSLLPSAEAGTGGDVNGVNFMSGRQTGRRRLHE